MSTQKVRYFKCLSYEKDPRPWSPWDDCHEDSEIYLRNVFRRMEEDLQDAGLTFYITWKLDELPSYGNDVVAFVMGDEWSRIPMYSHRVRAIFKCYGTSQSLPVNPLLHPSVLNLLLTVKALREAVYYIPGATNRLWQKARHLVNGVEPPGPMYAFPLGYGNQVELPVTDIRTRSNDIFFAGSINHGNTAGSLKRLVQSPKTLSRQEMIANLDRLQLEQPFLQVERCTTPMFTLNAVHYGALKPGEAMNTATYSERMMDSKICLVPRGTSPETFRYFEAMRYGCVLITERLPSRWFYDGSPAIQIRDWSELNWVVDRVLNDEELLRSKQQEALNWWKTKCSEAAVGGYIARKLNGSAIQRRSSRRERRVVESPAGEL